MARTSQASAGGGFCPFSLVLFAGTAYSYLNYLSRKHKKASSLKPLIIAGPSGKTHLISGSPIHPLWLSNSPFSLSIVAGVGKGTLIELLRTKYPTHFGFSVSHTTRNPREGEMNGVHYNFTTVEDMEKEIKEGKFIEYAWVQCVHISFETNDFVVMIPFVQQRPWKLLWYQVRSCFNAISVSNEQLPLFL